jgi:glycosyltransferase involved in cell wall biosynthesis
MQPRVTVCIPAYNRPDLLREALESLTWQDLERDEYVVAISDDASKEELEETVREYEDRLNILYRRNPTNVGHLANFEAVSQLCRTPYISFLPDDDLLAPGQLARALSVFGQHKDTVLVSSLIVVEDHPGGIHSSIHGMFLSGRSKGSYWSAYSWDRTEWLALSLINTPLSMIGSIFDYPTLQKCQLWKRFPLWHDRLMLAEMAFHGSIRSLPWIGGYNRIHGRQLNSELALTHTNEFREVTETVLALCRAKAIAVETFWVELICTSERREIDFFLTMLNRSLSREVFDSLLRQCEGRLGRRLKFGSRLEKWGVPNSVATVLRKLDRGLSDRL